MTNLQQIQEEIAQLSEKLISAHPSMPILLRSIHRKLKEDPAVVTLLTEEDIEIIVRGLKLQTKVEISIASSKTSNGKAIKNLGIGDL